MSFDLIFAELNDSPQKSIPRQTRLYQILKTAILDGRLMPGIRLPASRQLSADFGMARNSVLFAYQQLLAEGFLVTDRGGTRVAVLPLSRIITAAESYPAAARLLSHRARQLQPLSRIESFLPFAPGIPDLNAFPWQKWSRCLQNAWSEVSARQVAHAEPGGEPELRHAVARFLSARRGIACSQEQVFILPGGQVALDVCARLLADAGETVWLEDPCYPSARNAMLAAGLNVVAVPVDRDGMQTSTSLWQDTPPRLIYVTPAHQFPLGSVLGLERRLEMLNRLQPGDGWLIEDDYDSDFNHARPGARPQPAIAGLRPGAPVVYIGTFSQLLYPGLRIAYMVVPRWAVKSLGGAISNLYRGGQAVEQRALARFMESGQLTRHVRRMGPIYLARQKVLRAALCEHFGAECEILGGQAGLHLVLRLPESLVDTLLVDAAMEQGVVVRALSTYYASASGANGLILGYGMAECQQIAELVRRLGAAVSAAHG